MPAFPDVLSTYEDADYTAGDLITADYQAEIRGLLIGANTVYPITQDGIDGFGYAGVRESIEDRAQDHGSYVGPNYVGAGRLRMKVAILATGRPDLEARRAELGRAWAPVDPVRDGAYTIPLVFRLGGITYRVRGYPTRLAPDLRLHRADTALVALEFRTTDPRVYGNDLKTVSAASGSASGGYAYPYAYPHAYGTATPAIAVVDNAGNTSTKPLVIFHAGASGFSAPAVTNATTGETWASNITLTAYQSLYVNMDTRTVLLENVADRAGTVIRPSSKWPAAIPGINNYTFTGTGDATLEILYRDAYFL